MTALDLLLKPELLQAAKQYFAEQTKDTKWVSLVPDGVQPPIELNRDKMGKVNAGIAQAPTRSQQVRHLFRATRHQVSDRSKQMKS